MTNLLTFRPLGAFSVYGSGSIMASDPCYSPDTHCQKVVRDVMHGTWEASIQHGRVPGAYDWGDRVQVLTIVHATYDGRDTYEAFHELCVDSGQFGFFVLEDYQADGKGDYDDQDSFYGQCCKVTLGSHAGRVFDASGEHAIGVVSSSGFGDGQYTMDVHRNAAGKATKLEIRFID